MRRLNCGCGPKSNRDWINVDRRFAAGVDVRGDVTDALPFADGTFDYAVAIHVLQDLPYGSLVSTLRELHRVLRPGGVLRLGLPDLDRAIRAYLDNDARYFYIPDEDATCVGAKLCVQLCWYSSIRTPFTYDFAAELLGRSGFHGVKRCAYGETAGPFPAIVELDNRERESLFVEAFA